MGISVDAGNTYKWDFDASTGGYNYASDSPSAGPSDTGASEGGQWAYDQGVAGRFDEANAMATDAAYADAIRPIRFKETLPWHRPPQPRNIPQKYWRNPGIDITPEQRQRLQKNWEAGHRGEIFDEGSGKGYPQKYEDAQNRPYNWLPFDTAPEQGIIKDWEEQYNQFTDPNFHITPDDYLRGLNPNDPAYRGLPLERLNPGMVDRVEDQYKIDEKLDDIFKNFSTDDITKYWYAHQGANPEGETFTLKSGATATWETLEDLEAEWLFENARNAARGEIGGRKGPEGSPEEIDAMALRSLVRDMLHDLSGIGPLMQRGTPTTGI